MHEYPEIDFYRRWTHALAFRWGADLSACQGANMAATAYARATEGFLFDADAGVLLTPGEAAERVRKMEMILPAIEEKTRKIAELFARKT
jgi:hypothetical protein